MFGTDGMVAAGIDYVTGLAKEGHQADRDQHEPGRQRSRPIIEAAIDRAIAAGVIVVASAGHGEEGIGWPGADWQVIWPVRPAGRRSR